MAVDVERLVLQLSADIRRMERGLDRARRQADSTTRAIENRFESMSRSVSRSGDVMAENLRQAIAAIGVGVAVREVAAYADAWTQARNRLAAAGVASADLAERQAELVQLALRTRTDLGATVELYGRLLIATRDLGLSQSDAVRITEILNQAFVAGGASAAEQAGAIRQLSQALASGALRGEELTSVLENAPLIARAIADEFGVGVGELKRLGEEGELVSGRVLQGIANAAGTIGDAFGSTVSTIGEAFTNLRTSAIEYFGTIDQNLGVSQRFAGFINQIANNLELLGNAAVAAVALLGGRVLGRAFSETATNIREAIAAQREFELESRRAQTTLTRQAARLAITNQTDQAAAELARKKLVSIYDEIAANKSLVAVFDQRQKALQRVQEASIAFSQTTQRLAMIDRQGSERLAALQAQNRALQVLQEAQTNLERVEQSLPTAIRNHDAARRALTEAERTATRSARDLETVNTQLAEASNRVAASQGRVRQAFSALMTGVGGIAGSIAIWVALTAAIGLFTRAIESATVRLEEAIQRGERYSNQLAQVQQRLKEQEARYEAMAKAIRATGDAATDAAKSELDSLAERIRRNKELERTYRAQAAAQLASADAARSKAAVELQRLAQNAAKDATLTGESAELQRRFRDSKTRSATPEDFLNAAEFRRLEQAVLEASQMQAILIGGLTSDQRKLLDRAAEVAALDDDLRRLRNTLDGVAVSSTEAGISISTTLGGPDRKADRTSLREFQTELERFERTLAEIRASKAGEAEQSRAAVQAVLDYASATRDVAAAYAQVPAVEDILSVEDLALVNSELRTLAEDTIAQVGDSFVQLTNSYASAIDDIERARSAAIASGIGDLERFDRAVSEATRSYLEDMDDLTEVENPFAAMDIEEIDLPEFEVWGAEFRETMRRAVAEALRQGITTNNWGDALRSIVASAVTSAFEDAINRFADFLTDLLLGNGQSGGLLSGAARGLNYIVGGGRASGGPVMAGHSYRVNEAGKGEMLYMGRPGEVLTTSKLAQMLPGASARSISISSPVVFNGPVGADLAELENRLNQRDRQLMQILPRVVDARVMDSTMRRRYR